MNARAAMLFAWLLLANLALAQEEAPQPAREELDVTMQIIENPNAQAPEEVVRRIPLPVRKPPNPAGEQRATSDAAAKGKEPASEARKQGSEVSTSAKARASAEPREPSRRSAADEAQRNPRPPAEPPRPRRP